MFFGCVILAVARLFFIITLATVQRVRSRPRGPDAPYAPPVSVVVPAYREELVIVRTVESLLKQQYAGAIEIIVVDDGSPDDTRDVATRAFRDEPRVTVLTKPNGGKASALNHGIQRATSEIVVCLDADTQFEPRDRRRARRAARASRGRRRRRQREGRQPREPRHALAGARVRHVARTSTVARSPCSTASP